MKEFAKIYATAVERKGGEENLNMILPVPKTPRQLKNLADDRYLSEMSRRVFRAGLKHSMVDAKWPAFEKVFHQFNPAVVARTSDEAIEKLMGDTSIIRHLGKLRAVRANAQLVLDVAAEQGSFGKFIAEWPGETIVDLWQTLKKRGAQLGGQSGANFLRMVGKDTFLLTNDVVQVLINNEVVTKMPTGKRDLAEVQAAFNEWQTETDRPLCQLSRIMSFTVGDNWR